MIFYQTMLIIYPGKCGKTGGEVQKWKFGREVIIIRDNFKAILRFPLNSTESADDTYY